MGFPNSNLLNLAKQAKPLSVTEALLEQAVQDKLAQIAVNTDDIADINNSIGAANGIASLDAGGKLPISQLPALAIGDTHSVADQAAMLALTAERGDVAVITGDGNYRLAGDDASVLSNWVKLVDNEGVESILIDGVAATGQVSLAKIAQSGNSVDAAFSAAGFTSTNAKDAIVEVKTAVDSEVTARQNAISTVEQSVTDEATARNNADTALQGNIDTLESEVDAKLTTADMKLSQTLNGTIDGTNKTFTVPESFVSGTLRVWMNNATIHPDAYTVAGNDLTFVGSPDPGDAMFCDYVKAAA